MKKQLFYLLPIVMLTMLVTTSCNLFGGKSVVEENVELHKTKLPENIASGLELTDIVISGDSVIYMLTLDEDTPGAMPIAAYKENIEGVHKSFVDRQKTKNYGKQKEFIEACQQENKCIVYRFTGDAGSGSFDVVLYPAEVLDAPADQSN